ncbi:MAG TPA: M28 family peptidase, partial [Thermoleophilaceae bacterium]
IVVGAHYDTKDLPGFLGANDGAGGTAAVVTLARSIRPHTLRHRVVFVLFDGEESPAGAGDADFERLGLRGSRVAARAFGRARAMILLDFVADRQLRIPREANSDARLWQRLRAAARRVGAARAFPDAEQGAIADDHVPFLRRGVRAIDLIDFDFACWHRGCDDLSAVSERSLDASGETVYELLRSL